MAKKSNGHYIFYDTFHRQCREQERSLWPGPDRTRFGRIDGKKFSIRRNEYLDHYGNPVYTASIYDKYGNTIGQYRSNGSPEYNLQKALEKSGTKVKYRVSKGTTKNNL